MHKLRSGYEIRSARTIYDEMRTRGLKYVCTWTQARSIDRPKANCYRVHRIELNALRWGGYIAMQPDHTGAYPLLHAGAVQQALNEALRVLERVKNVPEPGWMRRRYLPLETWESIVQLYEQRLAEFEVKGKRA